MAHFLNTREESVSIRRTKNPSLSRIEFSEGLSSPFRHETLKIFSVLIYDVLAGIGLSFSGKLARDVFRGKIPINCFNEHLHRRQKSETDEKLLFSLFKTGFFGVEPLIASSTFSVSFAVKSTNISRENLTPQYHVQKWA